MVRDMVREHKWIQCGRAGRPFGVRGELVVDWSSGACPVEAGVGSVYVREGGDEYRPFIILSSRSHGKRHVVRFEGVLTRNDAEEMCNKAFFLPEHELEKLEENHYYDYQIVGLEVVTTDGAVLGTVTDIQRTGANDVYEVTPPNGSHRKSFYIPAVDHIVREIDLENKRMVIELVDGLVD